MHHPAAGDAGRHWGGGHTQAGMYEVSWVLAAGTGSRVRCCCRAMAAAVAVAAMTAAAAVLGSDSMPCAPNYQVQAIPAYRTGGNHVAGPVRCGHCRLLNPCCLPLDAAAGKLLFVGDTLYLDLPPCGWPNTTMPATSMRPLLCGAPLMAPTLGTESQLCCRRAKCGQQSGTMWRSTCLTKG